MRMNKEQRMTYYQTVSALQDVASRQGREYNSLEVIEDVECLYSIERQLANIAERVCCVPMTQQQQAWNESREKTLEERARSIALKYKSLLYRQHDPRGAQVYLVPQDTAYQGATEKGMTCEKWVSQYYHHHGITFCK